MIPTFKLGEAVLKNAFSSEYSIRDITGNYGDITYVLDAESGNYLPVTNESGYGLPNFGRENFVLFLFLEKKGVNEDELAYIEVDDSIEPSEFLVSIKEDGWYRAYLVAIERLNEEEVLESGEIRYDVINSKLVEFNGESLIDIPSEKLMDSTYIYSISDLMILSNSIKRKAELNRDMMKLLFSKQDCKTQYKSLKEDYELLRAMIEGATYEYESGNKQMFLKLVNFINENY